MAKGKLPKNIMPSFKPMAAMQQTGIEGQEHGEVDKAADTVAGLGWEATKKIIKKISSVFGGVLFKVIIVILIISILASILTSFLKDLDEMLDPTVGQTGEYIRKVSEVESKSFAKAYNYTTENILSALVSDGSPFAALFSGDETNEEKKQLLSDYITKGYVSMRDYNEYEGYLLFDMCIDGSEKIFAILEDETLGIDEKKQFSSDGNVKEWVNRLVIIEFGESLSKEAAIDKIVNESGIDEDAIKNIINNNNGSYFRPCEEIGAKDFYLNMNTNLINKYNQIAEYLGLMEDGELAAEFDTDIKETVSELLSVKDEDGNAFYTNSDKEWLTRYAKYYIIRSNLLRETDYIRRISSPKTEYVIEYKNGTIMNQGVSVAMFEAMFNYVYDYIFMEMCGLPGVASSNVKDDDYLELRYEMFLKFMGKESVWQNLLDYDIQFKEENSGTYTYELKDGNETVVIPNITSRKTAIINIDVSNYEKLLSTYSMSFDNDDVEDILDSYLDDNFKSRADRELALDGIFRKYGTGKGLDRKISVSLIDENGNFNKEFIRYMEGTSYSYRMLNDLSYYADVKFIETNCYIEGDKTIELVKSNDSDLYTADKQYSFKINPCYGFTSCVLDSIKIFGNELSANDYTYDEKTGYYTITSRIINEKMGGAQDKVDFHYEFVITIEAHAVGANIDNANFYGFRCFAAKDYIQSMKNSHGSGLYDVSCYIAEFDEKGNLKTNNLKYYNGTYDVIYRSVYEPYKTGSKRGKFTLYVMPNTSYTSDYDSAIDFLYYNSDKTAEMELRYYFDNSSTEGKLIEYKLGSQNDFIIIDPSMAYMQFTDGCRISGDSVASILSEGGYIRSSVFWQYKSKMYSALFIDPIAEPIHMPFFVDTDYIIDIKEVKNAASAGKQTTTYVVYCEPGTVIYQPNSCYIDSIYGVNRNIKGSNYYFLSEDGNNFNSVFEDIVAAFATSRTDYDPILDENGNEVEFAHLTDKNIYNTYYLSDLNFRYKLANIQVKFIDLNIVPEYRMAAEYRDNHFGIYLKNPAYSDAPTIEEYFMYWELKKEGHEPEGVSYHVEDRVNIYQPVILGCTLTSYDMEHFDSAGGSVPAFTLEIYSRYSGADRHKTVSREIDIYKLFNINREKNIYFDEGSGFFWPVEGEVKYKDTLVASKEYNIIGEDKSSSKLYLATSDYSAVYTLSPVDFDVFTTGDKNGKLRRGETVYFLNKPKIKEIETKIECTGANLNIDDRITIIDADYSQNKLVFTTSDWNNFYVCEGVNVSNFIVSILKEKKIEYALVLATMQTNGLIATPDSYKEDWLFIEQNISYLGETYGVNYKNLTGMTFENPRFKTNDTFSMTMKGTGFEHKEFIEASGEKVNIVSVDRHFSVDFRPVNISKPELGYFAFTTDDFSGTKYIVHNIRDVKNTDEGTQLYLFDEIYKIKVEKVSKVSGASEITFPILDGYEILGNGLFKSGVAIPYPEGYYMEDGVGIFTPVYAPVDAYIYAIECTDQLKGLYNITLYSEAEELYFEFIGIYNYYDTAVGQQHPFYPAVNKKVIAGDVIGKYRRIEDSGGIESSEWYNPVVYLIYNDNLGNKSAQFNINNNVLVYEPGYIYDIVKVNDTGDIYDITLVNSNNPNDLSIYYTYHNVKLIKDSPAYVYFEMKKNVDAELEEKIAKLFGNMRLQYGDELAKRTDSSYLTFAHGINASSEKYIYYFNPMYFYTDTESFNEALIWGAFYDEQDRKITSLIIYDDDYAHDGTSAEIKLNVAPGILPDGYTIEVFIKTGTHDGGANVRLNPLGTNNRMWQINLVERNGYGTDYIVAMLVNPKGEKRELARCAITVPSYAEYGSIYLTCKADNSMIKDSYYKVNSLRFDYILPYPSHIDGILSKSFRDALKTLLDKKSLNYDSVQNQFGYIDLYVPKGNDKEVKYDFNAYYNSPVSITDIEWKLYKAELNDSEHVISRLSGNSGPNGLITLSDMGVLIMKKSSTGESAANSSTDFYIVCAENKATGAIAYAIIRAVQPIESIQINKATYAYQDIKIEYETTLSNLHMTPYGELSLEYNYFPANATYADLDFNVLNKSYQGGEQVPQKNNDVSEQFSINFTENLIKIKYKNDRNKDAIIYKYFLGTYDADFLKFSVEFKKSDSVKVSEISFVITSDITDMQIIPVDGDLNNHGECEIRDIYVPDDNEFIKDVLNMKNPALIDWYSTNLDGNTIAQMLITGYYCEANASGDLIVKSGKLPYLAAKSVCNADQLTYESAFTMCKVKPIQQNGYYGNLIVDVVPNTLDVYGHYHHHHTAEVPGGYEDIRVVYFYVQLKNNYLPVDKAVVGAYLRINSSEEGKIIHYEVDGTQFKFSPYRMTENAQWIYDDSLFLGLLNDEGNITGFGERLGMIFEQRDKLGKLEQWHISAYEGDNLLFNDVYLDLWSYLGLIGSDSTLERLYNAQPRDIALNILSLLKRSEYPSATKYVFERVDDLSEEDIRNYMSGNDYEQKIIATLTEILTGKTVNPTIITDGTPVGNVYYGPVSIEINHPTENYSTPYTTVNRKIYYTINGNTPVPGSAGTYLYTGPVVLNPTKIYTVKAIAVVSVLDNKGNEWTYTSGIVSASYTVNNYSLIVGPKVFPDAGTYSVSDNKTLRVRLSSAVPGAKIYYTINGDAPTPGEATQLYTGPIDLGKGTYTIRAIAMTENAISEVVVATFKINDIFSEIE